MNKWKKRGRIALAGAMCLLMLAGCGAQGEPEASDASGAQDEIVLDLDAGPIKVSRPDKAPQPWQSSIEYEYLGLTFYPDEAFRAGLGDGSLYTQRIAMYNEERDGVIFAYQFLHYLPEDCGEMEYAVDWDEWFAKTERIGTVGVFRADYLADHPIETITECAENHEIGRSEDGGLIYYLSVDAQEHPELGEIWGNMKVEIGPVAEYVADEKTASIFNAFDVPRDTDTPGSLGDFQAQDLDGNPVDSSIFADYDLTMVNVMTTWCSSCIGELPDLAKLSQEVKDEGVQVITIVADTMFDGSVDQEALELARHIRDSAGVEYPMLVPDEVLLNGRLKGINAYPETFFVDSEGNIVGDYYVGAKDLENWHEVIDSELAKMGGGTVAMS